MGMIIAALLVVGIFFGIVMLMVLGWVVKFCLKLIYCSIKKMEARNG